MKRKSITAVAILLGLVVAFAIVAAFVGSRASKQFAFVDRNLLFHKFDKITLGMSQEEVESILGGPPGNYSDYGSYLPHYIKDLDRPEWVRKTWQGNVRIIHIWFERGLVAKKNDQMQSGEGRSSIESFFECLLLYVRGEE